MRKLVKAIKRKQWLEPCTYLNGWDIPVQVVSESNNREHWTKKNARKKEQQLGVIAAIKSNIYSSWVLDWLPVHIANKPFRITFTRCGGKKMDRSNLPVAFKGVEDVLADLLGIDDGHANWLAAWEQEPGGPVGIKIRIEEIS